MKIGGSAHVMQRRRDSVLIGCLVLIWGCNWPLNKVVFNTHQPAMVRLPAHRDGIHQFVSCAGFPDRRH